MNAEEWSHWATVIGVVVGACGLWFTGIQLRQTRKTAEYQGLRDLLDRSVALQRQHNEAVASGDARAIRNAEIIIYDFLELSATAVRRKLAPTYTLDFTRAQTIETLALVELYTDAAEYAQSAGVGVWENLAWFAASHRKQIDARKTELKRLEQKFNVNTHHTE